MGEGKEYVLYALPVCHRWTSPRLSSVDCSILAVTLWWRSLHLYYIVRFRVIAPPPYAKHCVGTQFLPKLNLER